ncbi:sugar kinase [Paenibacillus sp. J22TS3]|uniref:sugar kinase n=1 Tax=Paenibacillus sp. J22TS3 TaxID=2807192 RepID=UPI001B211B92|nr:sugar kinase [Paenibacillus sp. J22TS3]GIP23855.1 sugar kinase [Paenibacillus sp. J22TS3]
MNQPLTERKIVLIKRRTRLEDLVVRYNTVQQAEFYIERLGADFSDYTREDKVYREALAEAAGLLSDVGRVQILDRDHVPNFIFGEQDIIVVLGPDGLVANTLKYTESQPLIGVNPDPHRWDGVLLPFSVRDLKLIIRDVIYARRTIQEVTLAKAELNDGQYLYGVNDLFVGRRTHVSARYELRLNEAAEQQSSSGVIISTGLGSTGWLKSVLAGAAGIVSRATHQPLKLAVEDIHREEQEPPGGQREAEAADQARASWDSRHLYYTVREPFPSRTTAANLVFGRIEEGSPLRIVSQMPEDGVIFSDGIESDYLEFNSGVEAVIRLADKKGRLVV